MLDGFNASLSPKAPTYRPAATCWWARDAISDLREEIAEGLEAQAGKKVRISVRKNADKLTYRQMIETVARLEGKRRLIVEVPVLTPRLSSYWLHLVTPVRAGVAMPLVEGLRNPTVARDDDIRRLLPIDLTSFEDAARVALRGGGDRNDPV